MTISISNVYVQSYEQIVRHLAQQSETKLRGWVQERGVSSNQHNWETLDQTVAALKGGPRSPTPVTDAVWGRRVSVAATYDVGDTTEQEDPVQMLVDPNSNMARSQGMAMRRAQDDVIIAAATAAALEGDGGQALLLRPRARAWHGPPPRRPRGAPRRRAGRARRRSRHRA